MPANPIRQPDGTYSYGEEGYLPQYWRRVKPADYARLPQDEKNYVDRYGYGELVEIALPGETPWFVTQGVMQINQAKVDYYAAKTLSEGPPNIPMTQEELDAANYIVSTQSAIRNYEAQLGGFQKSQREMAEAIGAANDLISGWMAEDAANARQNQPPPPPPDYPADEPAADAGEDTNLDNEEESEQTAAVDTFYEEDYGGYYPEADDAAYSDYDWYQDQGYFEDPNYQAGYEYLGDGLWYDGSDNSVYDEATGEWTFDDSEVPDYGGDYSESGLESLGDGLWYDPTDGSVYDEATGVWMPGWAEDADVWTYSDGSTYDPSTGEFRWPDGSWLNDAGDFGDVDGSIMLANGDYIDPDGVLWANMAEAGAPNLYQNTQTGDVWNMKDGSYTVAQYVPEVTGGDRISYDQFLAQQRTADPANYARLTQTAGRPSGNSSSGFGGGGSGISLGGGGGGSRPNQSGGSSSGGVTLNDLNNLLRTATTAAQAVNVARSSGASNSQIATLQRQAQQAAQAVTQAKAAGIVPQNQSTFGGASAFLKQNAPVLIAVAGVAALFLLNNRRAPAAPTPAANVAA